MTERKKQFAEAAIRVIQRYGMKRTTMADIASEAGVSRQTLYTVYPSKDDVLRGVIRFGAAKSMEAIECNCSDQEDLRSQLTVFFEHMVIEPYRVVATMPDAADFIIGYERAAQEELGKAYSRYGEALREILNPHAAAIEASGLTVGRLADYVVVSAKAFKKVAVDEKELTASLGVLVTLVTSVTGQGCTKPD